MINNGRYILDEQDRVVPEPDLFKWGEWFQENKDKWIVARTQVEEGHVSTVFIGLDQGRFSEFHESSPVVWETTVFSKDKRFDQLIHRCSGNREQAEGMHNAMVARVKAAAT